VIQKLYIILGERKKRLKTLLILMFFAIIALLLTPTFASAEIKVSPPPNWQPAPNNNSTSMVWFQNSTKSVIGIKKAPDILSFPLFLAGPFVTQFLADKGVLESADQFTFGHSNSGYRYFLNLSSPSKLLDSFSGLPQIGSFLPTIPEGYDVPYKGMLILTQKQGDLYAIVFLSPKENFDSIVNQIKPTLDSIELINS
jgi:hypothetical protein